MLVVNWSCNVQKQLHRLLSHGAFKLKNSLINLQNITKQPEVTIQEASKKETLHCLRLKGYSLSKLRRHWTQQRALEHNS